MQAAPDFAANKQRPGRIQPSTPSPSSFSSAHPSSLLHLNSVVQAIEAPGAHTGCLEKAKDKKRELRQAMKLLGP